MQCFQSARQIGVVWFEQDLLRVFFSQHLVSRHLSTNVLLLLTFAQQCAVVRSLKQLKGTITRNVLPSGDGTGKRSAVLSSSSSLQVLKPPAANVSEKARVAIPTTNSQIVAFHCSRCSFLGVGAIWQLASA